MTDDVLEFINSHKCVFVNGPAGSGKSYLIKEIVKSNEGLNIAITSSTGISSTSIGGITVHSFLGMGVDTDVEQIVASFKFKQKLVDLRILDILIIDEISMISSNLFDTIHNILCYTKRSTLPFGGIRVICLGDFFQLPPVKGDYAFKSKYWSLLKPVNMNKIYRQTDQKYINLLNKVRIGEIDEDVISILNSKLIDKTHKLDDKLYLFPRNKEVDAINTIKFKEISNLNEIKTYHMDLHNTTNFTLIPNILKLCKRCKVILLINLDQERGLINGSVGIVKGFMGDLPIVEFENGITETIQKFIWTSKDKTKRISQIPLKLAYALSIHKSQGMTLENAVIDLKDCFIHGQLYVALSRIKNLDGLYIINFDKKSIIVDEDVKKYYKTIT
uniref:AAA+ ATPase domain-containing protein n=1 Tax=viral metagenome TaxID=1070528 RepID=A0A6C0J8I3_9ZZZZ